MSDRLEVWGDPVSHSLSPALHAAAYGVLGNGWTYGRRRVTEPGFERELHGLTPDFRGLSLTMPLKGVAFEAAEERDRRAQLTGAANTLLLGRTVRAFNTDVGGLVRALNEAGAGSIGSARIVGAGATATSALVALAELGAADVEVVARRPERASRLVELGAALGTVVRAVPLPSAVLPGVDLTVATLPGDAPLDRAVAARLATGGTLFDVVYGTWPTALSTAWAEAGLPASWGLGMLLHQALLQIRIFTTGDPEGALDDEAAVFAAMRDAIVS